MTSTGKLKAILFLGLAVLVTAMLATSLSQMALQPGMPPPAVENSRILLPQTPQAASLNPHLNTVLLSVLGIILTVYILAMIVRWVLGNDWRPLLSGALRFGLILAAIFAVLFVAASLLPGSAASPVLVSELPPLPEPLLTAPLGEPPALLLWFIGLGLAALAAFLAWTRWNARRRRTPVDRLACEIEQAHRDLLSGMGLTEVILRCYQQMSRVLQQEGDIERADFLTPAEFERELSAAGFPEGPVHRLTRLFEIARYSPAVPTPADEQAALDSLQAILTYLRRQKDPDRQEGRVAHG